MSRLSILRSVSRKFFGITWRGLPLQKGRWSRAPRSQYIERLEDRRLLSATPNNDFEGWANLASASWIGSTLQSTNSQYEEGEAIPFRFADHQAAGSHTIVLKYDFGSGMQQFFDALVSFDATESGVNPALGIDVAGATAMQVPMAFPMDTSLPMNVQTDLLNFPRFVTTYNIDTSSVMFGTYSLPTAGSDAGKKMLTMTYNVPDGSKNVVIAYGLHLANSGVWGMDNGAASAAGASQKAYESLDGGEDKNVSVNPNAIVPAVVSVSVAPAASVLEDGATNLVYTFTRNNTSPKSPALTINFTVGGTATEGSDFAAVGTTVTFAPGSSTATITIDPTPDSIVEPDETVILTVLPGSGYLAGTPSMATGTITNDDASTVSVVVAPISVLEDGAANLAYTFNRTNTTSETPALTVNFQTTGTATSGTDYAAVGTTVTFAAGSNTATVTVDPTIDTTVESNETVILTLLTGSGYTVGNPSVATGTITDDDTSAVIVTVSPDATAEDGAVNLVYTFTRTNTTAHSPTLTVNIQSTGTATSGSDYTAVGTTVTFAAGSSTATVTVDPTTDTTDEPDETVILTVLAGSGYTIGSPDAATGTITDDDVSAVSVAVAPDSVLEDGSANLVYTFTRNNTSAETPALTVNFAVSGTATSGTDYMAVGMVVSFAAGSGTATVTVDPTADSAVEPDETVILTVVSGSGYTIGSPNTATGTITNDDVSAVSVVVAPDSVLEDGTENLLYTFSRTNTTAQTPALTVNFAVSGTATSGTDYGAVGTMVSFAVGSSTATVIVDPTSDSAVESAETVILTLASGSDYTIGSPNAATGTITDDDVSAVSVTVSPSTVAEDGVANLLYTFSRTNTTAQTPALTVNFQVTGSATSGSDYGAVGTMVTFAAGSNMATVTVDPTADASVEPDETVILTVMSGSGYTIGSPNAATGTITDENVSSVSVTVSPSSVAEDGGVNLIYAFTRTSTSSETPALTVNFDVAGTATLGSDYAAVGTMVTFAAGSSLATVIVNPTTDATVESDETVILTVLSGNGYTVGSPDAATGTITDDDGSAVCVTVSPVSVAEDGAMSLVYTFTRTNTSAETPALAVNFQVTGSATSGSDFGAVGTMVSFAVGSSTATVTVNPTTDSTVEPDETVILTVVSGSGYTIGSPNAATGMITDDDVSTVSVWVAPDSVAEDGSSNLIYTFTRTNTSSESPPLSVNFNVTGTATSGSDFGAVGTMVTFATGSSTATVIVNPTTDATDEPDETVILTVLASSGYTNGSPDAATGTITDDDVSAVSVSVATASVTEDGAVNLVYTFTRNNTSAETPALTVNFQVTGTATSGSDFGAIGTTVNFAAGSSTATVTVDPTTDTIDEPDETVILNVLVGSGYTIGNPNSATGTITDDDVSTVSVEVAPDSVVEDDATNLVYTFTRSNTASETPALTVNFATTGSATSGSDYGAIGTVVTFAAGSSTATVIVDPTTDSTVEPAETVILTVVSGNGYTIGSPNAAAGTITDDDTSAVSITVSPATVAEDGVANLIYTFTRTNSSSETPALTVNFGVGGTATSGSDFAALGTTVSFAAGSSTATVTVDPTVDTTDEPDETVVLTALAGSGYTIGSPDTATGTITDDDVSAVSVTVAPDSVSEDGVTNLVYTFTRTNTSSETPALTVNLGIEGSATSGSDYEAVGTTVSFAAGSDTATVTVDPTADTTDEPNETVILTVIAGGGYSIGSPNAATGTIIDDDPSRGILVFGSDVGTTSLPAVKVFDSGSQTLKFVIDPSATYGATYHRGVRVATGDINGDGVADIVTAPARYKSPDIKIFDGLDGSLIGMFRANGLAKSVKAAAKFKKGVYLAVGDVTGDGKNDIVVSQELGAPKVLVYRNTGSGYGGTSGGFAQYSSKMVFSDFRKYIGGATVAVGDVNGDGRAEVIVGSGAGMRSLVRVFDVTPTSATTGTMTQIVPDIQNSFTGGVYVAAGDLNNDGKAEIVTGSATGTARAGAGSKVRIYDGSTGIQISSFDAFPTVVDVPVAAVRVAVAGGQIYAVQGPDGRSQYRVRVGTLDSLGNVNDLDSFFAGVTDPNDPFFFGGGLFLAANHNQ